MITISFFYSAGEKYFPSICSCSWAHFLHIIHGVTFLVMWIQPSIKCLLYLRTHAESLHLYSYIFNAKGSCQCGADEI